MSNDKPCKDCEPKEYNPFLEVIKNLSILLSNREKEISDLKGKIATLEEKLKTSGAVINYPFPQSPSPNVILTDKIWIGGCPDGMHEFPNPWMGIFPPPCKKCGYTPPNQNIVTCDVTSVGDLSHSITTITGQINEQ